MSHSKRLAGAVLVATFLPQGALAQLVTPKEIKETWLGKPLAGTLANGRSFTMIFSPDGALSISGEAVNDTGTWRMSDDGYCATWKTIRAGTERCFTVRRMGNGEMRVHNPDGSVSGYIARLE